MPLSHDDQREAFCEIETGATWRRLSFVSIVHFVLQQLKQIAQSLIYAVPALAISANFESVQNSNVLIGLLILVSFFLIFGVLRYWFYLFRIYNRHIEIKSGVFKKSHVNLPFWRVQNIKLEQPFYYRVFGYARVVLDTAGSAQEEAEIVAVPLHYAQQLKVTVLTDNTEQLAQANRAEVAPDGNPARPSTSNEKILNRRTLKDLVIHGITNNRVWILLGALAPFIESSADKLFPFLEQRGIDINGWLSGADTQWWQIGAGIVALTLVIMGCLALLSVIGAVLVFYGYELVKQGDRYIRRSGLLNVQEVSVRASRIQLALAKQDWLDVLLGRVNLYFEQNAPRHQTTDISTGKLLIPSVTLNETAQLLKEIMPVSKLNDVLFRPIEAYYLRYHLKFWLIFLALVFFIIAMIQPSLYLLLYAFITCVGVVAVYYLRFRRWGWAYDDEFIYVRRGFFGLDKLCFQQFKVQQITVKQSVFMRRKKVCSVTCILASGPITLPFLPEKEAYRLVNAVLYDVESTKRSWM